MEDDGGKKTRQNSEPKYPMPKALWDTPHEAIPGVSGYQAMHAHKQSYMRTVVYRATNGRQGDPPLPTLKGDRGAPVREYVERQNHSPLYRKEDGSASRGGQVPKTTGSPLPIEVASKMSQKLGADVSGARIHTGAESAKAAAGFGAHAFTVGNDIHFGAGKFETSSKEGQKLLAHELTHVIQGQKAGVQRKTDEGEEHDAEEKAPTVSDPTDPAEVEADAKAEDAVSDHGDDEDTHPNGKEGGGDNKRGGAKPTAHVSRAQPGPIARAGNGTPIAKMFSPHDSAKKTISNIGVLWNKTKLKEKLRKSPADQKAFEDRKQAISDAFTNKEADYNRVKGSPTEADVVAMISFYTDLATKAAALEVDLLDYTKSVEQIAKEAEQVRAQIEGALNRAKEVGDPAKIPAINLPDFATQKADLIAAMAEVDALLKEDDTAPKSLAQLREKLAVAERLRSTADQAFKLNNVLEAMKPYREKVEDIISQTTSDGRPNANIGNGTAEAAAIAEAKSGEQTKGCWHGPKCRMDSVGLGKAIASLETLKSAFPEPVPKAKIDELIERAKLRQAGLDEGAAQWKASPHYSKAPFDGT